MNKALEYRIGQSSDCSSGSSASVPPRIYNLSDKAGNTHDEHEQGKRTRHYAKHKQCAERWKKKEHDPTE